MIGEDEKRLSSLPILMLADGTITSASQGPVYFQPDAQESKVFTDAADKASIQLSSFVKILHPDIGKDLNGRESKSVLYLLSSIGVQSITFQFLVENHILSEFERPAVLEQSQSKLVALLTLVCYFWSKLSCAAQSAFVESFKGHAVLWTSKGAVMINEKSTVHFSSEFENKLDPSVLKCLVSMNWNFLSGAYVKKSKINLDTWRKFFKQLGVTDFVSICPRQLTVERQDARSKWRPLLQNLKLPDDVDYTIDDRYSFELEHFFQYASSAVDKGRLLLSVAQFFNKHWEQEGYSSNIKATVQGQNCEVPSSFGLTLIETPWLSRGVGSEVYPPSTLWSNSVRHEFEGLDFPYVHSTLTNERFLEAINVQISPTVSAILRELKRWSEDPTFQAHPTEMARVYGFLSSKFQTTSTRDLVPAQVHNRSMRKLDLEREIQDQFNKHKLVFLPPKSSSNLGDSDVRAMAGNFYQLSVLRFKDQTNTIESQLNSPLRIVDNYYSSKLKKRDLFDAERSVNPALQLIIAALIMAFFTFLQVLRQRTGKE